MCSMGPDFFLFLKKLEDNNDKLPYISKNHDEFNISLNYEYNNSSCHLCNGYYGPSFGEPVCVTCHAFLFPDFPSYVPPSSYYFTEKTDDGDSGNDEPSDLNYSSDRRLNKISLPQWLSLTIRNQLHVYSLEATPDDDGAHGSNMPSGSGSSKHKTNGESSNSIPKVLQYADSQIPIQTPNLARSLQALSTPHLPDNLQVGLLEQLPSEVLLCIFGYLDDMSLCACGFVCDRWRCLVRAYAPPARWAEFTAQRWPLYKPLQPSVDWQKKYESLVESSFCRHCLVQMCASVQPPDRERSHWRRNRLRSELKMLRNDPPEGIAATPLDPKCCHWQASVTGPVGSPYEGGIFYLYIQVPYTYPMDPPVVRFVTRILHPNVSRHGDVGIDSVHHNWSLALTVSKVLISIQSLLTDPYTAVCMEPEIGEMYINDRTRFETLARSWTWRYAMHDII